MEKRGKTMEKLNDGIPLLANDGALPSSRKDYTLTRNFSRFRELYIEPDWSLIYYKKAS